ncbi:MAG: hypothetical protein IMZ55_16290, partial [Acidobacteria bacterium]|nr:hypothetical protein [Acidobacteriota bacterium]
MGHRGPGWQYAWTEIAKAVKEGKIRHAGVSNFSSMLRRGIEEPALGRNLALVEKLRPFAARR